MFAEDGGDFRIWLKQTSETSAIYQGTDGHRYDFLALATDMAGNREPPPATLQVPDDGSRADLGALPSIPESTQQSIGNAPPASQNPPANSLFNDALLGIPAPVPSELRRSEFSTVISPLRAEKFVSGIESSQAGIGPMAIVVTPDGESVLISGGVDRSQIYRVSITGGAAGQPWASLDLPIYDMAFDSTGRLWATTGGGPLLEIDPLSGVVLGRYGDSLTQALAIHPLTGQIFVSSGNGIEIFDPSNEKFTHFSDFRVGGLAFSPTNLLWGTQWPQRGNIVRFDDEGMPEAMLQLESPADSLAFGEPCSILGGLLFISNNDPAGPKTGSLTMVDLSTLRRLDVATGGTRGDVVRTTADGRILVSQSNQVDVLSPLRAPQVTRTNPPPGATVALPRGSLTITFDSDMFVGDSSSPGSVLNPANYELVGNTTGSQTIDSIRYDAAQRTATISFSRWPADTFTLLVKNALVNVEQIPLASSYSIAFQAISDFTLRSKSISPVVAPTCSSIRSPTRLASRTKPATTCKAQST